MSIWLSELPLNSIAKKSADVRSSAEGPLVACFVLRLTAHRSIDGRLRNIDDLVLCEIVRYGCYNDGQDDRRPFSSSSTANIRWVWRELGKVLMPRANLPSGGPRKASQRRARSASQPSPPPAFIKGDRVRWNHHEGEILSISGDAAEVLSAGRRWRVAVTDLMRA
jgi:hypothetical protein